VERGGQYLTDGEIPRDVSAANLSTWKTSCDAKLAIDPERGRFLLEEENPAKKPRAEYCYAFSGGIGAGTDDRASAERFGSDGEHTFRSGGAPVQPLTKGVVEIGDSYTYSTVRSKSGITDLSIVAADQCRPYLELTKNWVLTAKASTQLNGNTRGAYLLLDGLWIGSSNKANELTLRGNFEKVVLSRVTIDPGGAVSEEPGSAPLPHTSLVVDGSIEDLVIESSIVGPILCTGKGVIERLTIRDSIVQSTSESVPAMRVPTGETTLEHVTLLGRIEVHRLWATETLATAAVEVADAQTGCFRFGGMSIPQGKMPRTYESHQISSWRAVFNSTRFGNPGYCQLSEISPVELRRGAQDGSEIGAFSSLLNPIRQDSLLAKVEEYMPFGLIPLFIYET
jgi:hypothetical protein